MYIENQIFKPHSLPTGMMFHSSSNSINAREIRTIIYIYIKNHLIPTGQLDFYIVYTIDVVKRNFLSRQQKRKKIAVCN